MKQLFLQFTVPNWVKWSLVGIGLFVLCGIGYSIYIYQTIETNKSEGFSVSEQRTIDETDIVEVDTVSRYHGDSYYHTIIGKTNDGSQLLAYVNMTDNQEDIKVYSLDDFMTVNELEKIWRGSCNSCELLHTQYGIRGDIPLLELAYIDENNRLSYTYYRLKDGEIDSSVSFSSNDF